MNNPDFVKWVKLSFKPRNTGILLFYEDGFGNKVESVEAGRSVYLDFFPIVRIAPEIDNFMESAVKASPRERETRDGLVPVPLAVFLDINEIPERIRFFWRYSPYYAEDLISRLFEDTISPNLIQTVIYAHNREKTTFKLPFQIHFSGGDSLELMNVIRSREWYFNDQVVAEFGLRMTASEFPEYSKDIAILVIQDGFDKRLIDKIKKSEAPGLRLIIFLERFNDFPYQIDVSQLGVPCLVIRYKWIDSIFSFLKDFLYSIIHDFSIHEAFYFARTHSDFRFYEMLLFASPSSNQNLRMGAALESYKRKVEDYARVMNPGNTINFIEKLTDVSPEMRSKILGALSDDFEIKKFFDRTQELGIYFHGESTGLVPMAHEEQQFQKNLQNLENIKARLDSLVNDNEVFQLLREKQQRLVDITIDEFNASLIYTPVYKSNALLAGREYRVNVSIGQHSQYSLMKGEVPSIDPLLPDPEGAKGHLLDIVIFPKDFHLQSPAFQQVYLPLLGSTDPVRFEVIAPKLPGKAELRVKIFHKNNLLQAFLLEAEVSNEYKSEGENMISVSLDLSTTSQFNNIDAQESRLLYIGMNRNENDTHSLFIKKDLYIKEIDLLTNTMVEGAQANYTKLLTNAYFDQKGDVRFSAAAKPGSPLSSEFYDQVREFARFGWQCYTNLFSAGGDELKTKLLEIREAKDKGIQIGKHDLDYSFPWSMLYDYNLPLEVMGEKDYPVCLGQKFSKDEYKTLDFKPGFGCPHNPDIQTFCIEGFWGTRHKLEHLFANSAQAEFVDKITVSSRSEIIYSYNIHDIPTDALTIKMNDFLPKVFTVGASTNLMDLLWDVNSRPTALIVFGHLETSSVTNEPIGPRIITFPKADWKLSTPIPGEKWIHADLLFNYFLARKKWINQPLPVVFLINCSSAALNVASLNRIVKGFHTAGASAIIGTECDITSGLGARFVEEVLDGLYNQQLELGEAIQLFNKNLFASGIPLAFVFTCYGNINLKVSVHQTLKSLS